MIISGLGCKLLQLSWLTLLIWIHLILVFTKHLLTFDIYHLSELRNSNLSLSNILGIY